jgi:hypothetical protein
MAVLAALARRSEGSLAAGFFFLSLTSSVLDEVLAAGLAPPSLARTGLSPQISSRW